eukprot:scaffold201651_cov18-Tisochrysis_lutea.AAC.1
MVGQLPQSPTSQLELSACAPQFRRSQTLLPSYPLCCHLCALINLPPFPLHLVLPPPCRRFPLLRGIFCSHEPAILSLPCFALVNLLQPPSLSVLHNLAAGTLQFIPPYLVLSSTCRCSPLTLCSCLLAHASL